MQRIVKSSIVVVLVWILLVAMAAGGVILGAHPASRNMLRTVLPQSISDVLLGESPDFPLQDEVLEKLEKNFYLPIVPSELEDDTIRGMLEGLGDEYTNYFDPEQYASFQERAGGTYSGVGMTVEMKGPYVTVVSTFRDSPASDAGLVSGDVILAVDGEVTEGLSLDEVVARIKGKEGTQVELKVYRVPPDAEPVVVDDGVDPHLPEGGTTEDVVLVRKNIVVPVLEVQTLRSSGKKVAHIEFVAFSEDSAQRLRDAVTAATEEGVSAIILDLRRNGGGLLNEAVDVASIFIPEGVIVTTQGFHSPKEVFTSHGSSLDTSMPVYVLVDEFSASASEIVAGALKDTGRGTLVGTTTFGKGLVQSVLSLSNGGALKVTTAVYYTPSGQNINEKGIEPDVVMPDDPATVGVDETLQKALSLAVAGD